MHLRRRLPAALALATALACQPSLETEPSPTPPGASGPAVDFAVFDPGASPPAIPLPNDLALQPSSIATQSGAQAELLRAFAAAGGFPEDQETPITIDFHRETVNTSTGEITLSAPDLDLPSLGPTTLAVIAVSPALVPEDGEIDPPQAADYVKLADRGTLTLHHRADPVTGSRRWKPGFQYIVAVRGGASGVRTIGGGTVNPQPTMYLITRGVDLTLPENDFPGTTPAQKAAGEQLRRGYASAFAAVSGVAQIPVDELAIIQTFRIAPATGTHVETDASAGLIPLPSDLLLDPATGKVQNITAFCGGVFDETPAAPALPSCPVSRGLATLDGFSTTATVFSQTSAPILASTVNAGTVLLYEIGVSGPTRVFDLKDPTLGANRPGYVSEPLQLARAADGTSACAPGASDCVSSVVALQPAVLVPSSLTGSTDVPLPPLKEATEYAVLVTTGVKGLPDAANPTGTPLARSTVGKILLFQNPLADLASGKSLLQGVPDSQAVGLESMRLAIQLALAKAQADGKITDAADVAMAYTFRTQSITGKGNATDSNAPAGVLQLAATPYTPLLGALCQALAAELGVTDLDCTKPLPGTTRIYTSGALPAGVTAEGTIASAFDKYGVETGETAAPTENIGAIIEAQIVTINALDDATGALNPDQTKWRPEVIDVLIAVPMATIAPACTGDLAALAALGGRCPPLTVFQHGITFARPVLLGVANALNGAGVVAVAIDLPKHGNRSFCSQASSFLLTGGASKNAECIPGQFCVPEPALAKQGDAVPATIPAAAGVSATPGRCRIADDPAAALGTLANKPTLCVSGSCPFTTPNPGFPAASGEFFASGNFFRTRDSIRQAAIDHAQLIQVMAPMPTGATIQGNDVYNALAAHGLFVNPSPATTGYLSLSLGSMIGTVSVAANPRISRAVLNTNGGTVFDVVTSSPSLKARTDLIFAGLGISDRSATDPTTAALLLKTTSVAKWILDPAEPINFAGHLKADPLPNLLGPGPIGGNPDGSVAQAGKAVLAQIATCDQTVPNPSNALAAGDVGLAPVVRPTTAGSGTVQWFVNGAAPAVADVYPGSGCLAGLRVSHDFLWDFGAGLAGGDRTASSALTDRAQSDAASFLGTITPADKATLVVSP
jgi:hypothetical protein